MAPDLASRGEKGAGVALWERLLAGRCCHTNLIPATRCLEGPLASGRGGGSPRPERFVSEDAKRAAGCEMTLDVERVVNGGVNGQEALG